MLSQAQKDFIAKAFGISSEELDTGIASESEATFEVPTGKFYSESDITTLTDNSEKSGYDRGAQASREMTLKDLSKKAGFENIAKSGDEFINAYKEAILKDAQAEPSEKVAELSTTIEELRGIITGKEQEFSDLRNEFAQKERNNTLKGLIPDLTDKVGLTQDEALNLFLSAHEVTESGIKRNGEVLYDD